MRNAEPQDRPTAAAHTLNSNRRRDRAHETALGKFRFWATLLLRASRDCQEPSEEGAASTTQAQLSKAAIVALETAAAGPKQSHDAGVAAIGVEG